MSPYMLSILRIVVALLFMEHGTQKLFNFPPRPPQMGHFELMSLVGAAGILEFFGGLLLLLGACTRPVAFILAGEMAYAFFMVHTSMAYAKAHTLVSVIPVLSGGELAALYCFTFLSFVFAGAGKWSIDALFRRTQE
jgi:putative oxidoreductase